MPQAPALRDTSESHVAELVTRHHRRRGWAWVAVGSLIGLAVYAGIDINLFEHLTGTAANFSVIPVVALLALVVVGLVVVIVDTSRIRRADSAVRVSAKCRVSHYPWYAHAHSWPPRHPGSWVAAIFMLIVLTCITGFMLPSELNAWAYVVGAEHTDTFNPVSYSQCPIKRGCQVVTEGYLSNTGAHVNWGTQVPLDQPFSVRDPLWAWGTGRSLIDGTGSAIPDIVAGLFFDGVALLLLYVLVVIVRDTSPSRNQRKQQSVPADSDPGGVHRTHHPDHRHHADGTPRRRSRGRR
jgi:hypothetical protein